MRAAARAPPAVRRSPPPRGAAAARPRWMSFSRSRDRAVAREMAAERGGHDPLLGPVPALEDRGEPAGGHHGDPVAEREQLFHLARSDDERFPRARELLEQPIHR